MRRGGRADRASPLPAHHRRSDRDDPARSRAATRNPQPPQVPTAPLEDAAAALFALERIARRLAQPVYAATPAADPATLFVVERAGRVLLLEDGELRPEPFLDIRERVRTEIEEGLHSIAFHPGYADNGRFFVVYWACGGRGGVRSAPSSAVPRCRQDLFLELHVNYPDCWDGRRLDSADHMSHMAHSTNFRCPASHPVKLPLIRLNVRYPTRGGAGITLASGGQFSGHADFVNAWEQAALTELVNECFRDRCNDAFARARN